MISVTPCWYVFYSANRVASSCFLDFNCSGQAKMIAETKTKTKYQMIKYGMMFSRTYRNENGELQKSMQEDREDKRK